MAQRVIYRESYPVSGSLIGGFTGCCCCSMHLLVLMALCGASLGHLVGTLKGLLIVIGLLWLRDAPRTVKAYEIGPEGLTKRFVLGSRSIPWHAVLEVQVGRHRPWIRTTGGELDLRSVVGGKRLARRVRAVLAEEPVPGDDCSPLAPGETVTVRARGVLDSRHDGCWQLIATIDGIEVRSHGLCWWVPWHEADFARPLRPEERDRQHKEGWLIGFQGGQLRLFTMSDAAARLAEAIGDARKERSGGWRAAGDLV